MAQLLSIPLAFIAILVLAGRRVSLWKAMLAGIAIIALMSWMPWLEFLTAVGKSLIERKTVELVLGVAAVTALAAVLRGYGLLRQMVDSLSKLIGSPIVAFMAVPSAIGALPVSGGAILSCPMVEDLGNDIGLSPARMAAVNLIFRHAWFFVVPIFPVFILTCQISGVSAGQLALWQWPNVLIMLGVGYIVLLRPGAIRAEIKARKAVAEAKASSEARGATGAAAQAETAATAVAATSSKEPVFLTFLRTASPLLIAIVLILGVGSLKFPLPASVGVGLVWALILSKKAEGFKQWGLPVVWKGINWDMVLSMAAVMVFAGIVKTSGAANAMVVWLEGLGLPVWLLVVVLPFLVSLILGQGSSAMGVALPLILPLTVSLGATGPTVVAFLAAFVAYMISPVHLCQLLTMQYFKVKLWDLYRLYWPVIAVMTLALGVYTWLVFG